MNYGNRALHQERPIFNFNTYRKRYIEYYDLEKGKIWSTPMKKYFEIVMKLMYEKLFVEKIQAFLEKRNLQAERLRNSYPDRKLPQELSRMYDSKRFDLFLLHECIFSDNENIFDKDLLLKIKLKIQEIDLKPFLEYDCMVRADFIYRDLRIVCLPLGFNSIGKHVGHFIGYYLEDIMREIITFCFKKYKRSIPMDTLDFMIERYNIRQYITEDLVGSCLHAKPNSFKTRVEKIEEQEINYNCGKHKRKI